MNSSERVQHPYRFLNTIKRKFTNKDLQLDRYFVQLEILCVDTNEFTERNRFGYIERAFSRRDEIPGRNLQNTGIYADISDIIKLDPLKETPYRALLVGSPGTGKSTLSQKIAYQLNTDEKLWPQFKTVICLQLRNLKGKILEKFLNSLKLEGNDILYILDGWDEIQTWWYEEKSDCLESLIATRNSDDSKKVRNDIVNVLHDFFIQGKENITRKNFILTTRPNVKLNFTKFDAIFEIRGFSEVHAKQYIRLVLKEDKKEHYENSFIEYINSNNIRDMVTIPLFLDALLYTWDDIVRIKSASVTFTGLYEALVHKLIGDRDITNKDKEKEFRLLTLFGKKWLEGEQIYLEFQLNDFVADEVSFIKTFKQCPCLNAIDTDEDCEPNNQRYELIHLTFLEFFAAYYLVNILLIENENEFVKTIRTKKYDLFYNIVFRFVAGLICSNIIKKNEINEWRRRLEIFYDCMEWEPIDFRATYYFELIIDCLNECEGQLDVNRSLSICKEMSECPSKLRRIFKHVPLSYVQISVESNLDMIASLQRNCTISQLSDVLLTAIMNKAGWCNMTKILVLCKQSTITNFCLKRIEAMLNKENVLGDDWKKLSATASLRILPYNIIERIVTIVNDQNRNDSNIDDINSLFAVHNLTALQTSQLCFKLLEPFESHNIFQQITTKLEGTEIWKLIVRLIVCIEINRGLFHLLKNISEFTQEIPSALEFVIQNQQLSDEKLFLRVMYLIQMFDLSEIRGIERLAMIMNNKDVTDYTSYDYTRLLHTHNWTVSRAKQLFNKLLPASQNHPIVEVAAKSESSDCWKLIVYSVVCIEIKKELICVLHNFSEFVQEMPSALEFVLQNLQLSDVVIHLRVLFLMEMFIIYEIPIIRYFIVVLQHNLKQQLWLKSFHYIVESGLRAILTPIEIDYLLKQYETIESWEDDQWDLIKPRILRNNVIEAWDMELKEISKNEVDTLWECIRRDCSSFFTDENLVLFNNLKSMELTNNQNHSSLKFFSHLFHNIRILQFFICDLSYENYAEASNKAKEILDNSLVKEKINFEVLGLTERQKRILERELWYFLFNIFTLYDKCASIDKIYCVSERHLTNIRALCKILRFKEGAIFDQIQISSTIPIPLERELVDSPLETFSGLLRISDPPLYILDSKIYPNIKQSLPTDFLRKCVDSFTANSFGTIYQDIICRGFRIYFLKKTFWSIAETFIPLGIKVKVKDLLLRHPTSAELYSTLDHVLKNDPAIFKTSTQNFKIDILHLCGLTVSQTGIGRGDKDLLLMNIPESASVESVDVNILLKYLYEKMFIKANGHRFGHYEQWEFCTYPLHLDMSSTLDYFITDGECISSICPFIERHIVHSLVLSNNQITEKGFECLMRACLKKNTMKYLVLDGNRIFLNRDEVYFKKIFSNKNCLIQSLSLFGLDLSGNFIQQEPHGANRYSDQVLYERKNKCNVVHARSILKKYRPMYFFTTDKNARNHYDKQRDFISSCDRCMTHDDCDICVGCVFYAKEKQYWSEFSSHVVIYIERVLQGQRILESLELFNDNGYCKIKFQVENPNSIQFKERLMRYSVSPPVYPSLFLLKTRMLEKIKSSKSLYGMKKYGLRENGIELNCVTYANSLLKDLVGSDVIELVVPPYSFLWLYRTTHTICTLYSQFRIRIAEFSVFNRK